MYCCTKQAIVILPNQLGRKPKVWLVFKKAKIMGPTIRVIIILRMILANYIGR